MATELPARTTTRSGRPARRRTELLPVAAAALALLTAACTDPTTPSESTFRASWQGKPLDCSGAGIALNDLRFFVSDLVLLDATGREYALILDQDGRWQQDRLALIDLEDGSGACVNGTPALNASIRGQSRTADIAGIEFTVGVPFEQNHANPLLADSPLDDSAMHWHWRSGYKFLRAGIATATGRHWLHLGSTGCEGTVQNISRCRAPNRVRVRLSVASPSPIVDLDLARLFDGIAPDTPGSSECSSGPAEKGCLERFAALGLPFGDRSAGAQRVFRADP